MTCERVLYVFLKSVVLLPELSLALGFAAGLTGEHHAVHGSPGFEAAVGGFDSGVQIAIGKVQVPIGVFHVAEEIRSAI